MKPVLLYDLESRLSRARVAQWRCATRQEVEYIPYTDSWGTFPEAWGKPPQPTHATLYHFVDRDGNVSTGGAAAAQIYRHSPDQYWRARLYDRIPIVRTLWDGIYDWMATHRQSAEWLHWALSGRDEEAATYTATRWLFYRLLGLAFVCAFASLWWQVIGLNGENGITPVAPLVESAKTSLSEQGWAAPVQQFVKFPTLFLFVEPSDTMIATVAIAGLVVSILLTVGIVPPIMAAAAWFLYLSFLTVNVTFLSFQWDALLMEVGFLAIFFAPWQLIPGPYKRTVPSPTIIFLYRVLLFRLMFGSGWVKWGHDMWDNSTALTTHFQTQPLPTIAGWYAHHLPFSTLRWMTWSTMMIELVLPFFIFAPRRFRAYAGCIFIAFQILIGFTGNYGFFNLLTLALCVLLFDDSHLRSLLTATTFRRIAPMPVLPAAPVFKRLLCGAIAVVVIPLGAQSFLQRAGTGIPGMGPLSRAAAPFYVTSAYGLFARMTPTRPELIIEGSNDGIVWEAYTFRWKPGPLDRVPGWCQPHMPRLDWQMWFEALNADAGGPPSPWFQQFLMKLLANDEDVLKLMAKPPTAFEKKAPAFIRVNRYAYEFTSMEKRRSEGEWWQRTDLGPYIAPTSLR